jgi:hypothetical protein
VWTLDLEDGRHTVELEHGFFSGRRAIRVDGRLLEQSGTTGNVSTVLAGWLGMGSERENSINGHGCVVQIRSNGVTYNYDLMVDGRSVSTG